MTAKTELPVLVPAARTGPLMRISRRYTFEAAHRLPKTPPAHKCHRLHGHSYVVEVEVSGRLEPDLGWVIDFGVLDAAWGAAGAPLDHRYLNELEGLRNPTSEVLAAYLWERLDAYVGGIKGVALSRVTVYENARSSATLEASPGG